MALMTGRYSIQLVDEKWKIEVIRKIANKHHIKMSSKAAEVLFLHFKEVYPDDVAYLENRRYAEQHEEDY
jgi:hypothetical protein